MVPFAPRGMTADEVKQRCIEARQALLQPASIFRRSLDFSVNGRDWFMWSHFFSINLLFRSEVLQRKDFPLGDEAYSGALLKAEHAGPLVWAEWRCHERRSRARRRADDERSVGC